ncbi:MAG: hypothetical protein V4596_10585 [Bdellovibrionota bacterium]
MKILILAFILMLSLQAVAAPRAYYSSDKNNFLINGREASGQIWGFGYRVPGEFSNNINAHEIYKDYVIAKNWSGVLLWVGFPSYMIGAFDNNDRLYIGGAAAFIVGAFLSRSANLKLQKAINIYNGVPSDLAIKTREERSNNTNYALGWKFEF